VGAIRAPHQGTSEGREAGRADMSEAEHFHFKYRYSIDNLAWLCQCGALKNEAHLWVERI